MSQSLPKYSIYCNANYSNFSLFENGVSKRYNFSCLPDAMAYAQILAAGDILMTIYNGHGQIVTQNALLQPLADRNSDELEEIVSRIDRLTDPQSHFAAPPAARDPRFSNGREEARGVPRNIPTREWISDSSIDEPSDHRPLVEQQAL